MSNLSFSSFLFLVPPSPLPTLKPINHLPSPSPSPLLSLLFFWDVRPTRAKYLGAEKKNRKEGKRKKK